MLNSSHDTVKDDGELEVSHVRFSRITVLEVGITLMSVVRAFHYHQVLKKH